MDTSLACEQPRPQTALDSVHSQISLRPYLIVGVCSQARSTQTESTANVGHSAQDLPSVWSLYRRPGFVQPEQSSYPGVSLLSANVVLRFPVFEANFVS